MLKVNNLEIGIGKVNLVDGISFDIAENESLSIIGESGSGKSLTATCIMGLLPDALGKKGEINFYDKNLLKMTDKEISKLRLKEIAMIYQNPFNALVPVMTIKDQLNYIYKIQRLPYNHERIESLMAEVNLPMDYLMKYPYELSGGELQRMVILMSMVLLPKLLICDEPTTALDSETGLRIIALLDKLKQEHNMSLLFISHDLTLANKISDKVLIMQNGKIIESGLSDVVYNHPKEDYTKNLLEAAKF